jgi:hypothetical protein
VAQVYLLAIAGVMSMTFKPVPRSVPPISFTPCGVFHAQA